MTNNEREEYRLAALAAGETITIDEESDEVWISGVVGYWWPRLALSHAFKLMIDAKITLDPDHGVSVLLADGETFHTEPINGNPMLAIFKCAVAKGKSMENYK